MLFYYQKKFSPQEKIMQLCVVLVLDVIMVIILQYIQILNHYVVHLKLICYMSITCR